MAQILDPLPFDQKGKIICCYVNATSHIQIARISNVPNWYFERVVFPGQRLFFEAIKEAFLEIHTGLMASAILSDKIPCTRLCVEEEDSSDLVNVLDPDEDATIIKQSTEVETQKRQEAVVTMTTATAR